MTAWLDLTNEWSNKPKLHSKPRKGQTNQATTVT